MTERMQRSTARKLVPVFDRSPALSKVDASTQTPRVLSLRRRRRMPINEQALKAEKLCKQTDETARLAFVGNWKDRTLIRLRSAKSVDDLKATLVRQFPLGRVKTFQDCLDDTVGAELELPGKDEELLLAKKHVRSLLLPRLLRWCSLLCLIISLLLFTKESCLPHD